MFPATVKPATSVRLQYAVHLKALPAAHLDELYRHYDVAAPVLPPSEIMV
jgi:hypothetical protein